MKKTLAAVVAPVALALGLGACHSNSAAAVCRDVKPAAVTVLRAYTSSTGGQSICEGFNSGGRYYWAVNNADHRILYNNFYPF